MIKTVVRIFSVLLFVLVFNTGCSFVNSSEKNNPPKLYFAQPIAAYNSKTVERLLPIIQKQFPEWNIENPNQPYHQTNYEYWKRETGKEMYYYFNVLLPHMSGGIILPFPDVAWSAGAYGEALRLEELGLPIWKIMPDGTITKTTTEQMYLWDGGVLSVSQTRERNKISYDEWLEKYEQQKKEKTVCP